MSLIRLCMLVAFACCVTGGAAQADEPKAPKPLPKEITDAWKKAGAEVGWIGPITRLHRSAFSTSPAGAGEVPGFSFDRSGVEAALKNLPVPAEPFGLDLSLAEVTDAGLKELGRF